MSTDDLVRRARAEVPTFALVSELADEVDRLRAENDSLHSAALEGIRLIAGLRYQVESRTAERDAARAALERVRGLVEDGDRLDGLWIYAPDLARALEGES